MTCRAFKRLTTYRKSIFKTHKEYKQSLLLNIENSGGEISFEITDLNTKEVKKLDKPETGKYFFPLERNHKIQIVIRSKAAVGKYLIQKKLIKETEPNIFNLEENRKRKSFKAVRFVNRIITCRPKIRFLKEQFPNEPIVLLSNHVGKKAPSKIELFYPRDYRMWGTHEMTEGCYGVRQYLRTTYFYEKKHFPKWIARLLGTILAPFVNAYYRGMKLIPTYDDFRFMMSIKLSLDAIDKGLDIIIYPEDSSEGYKDNLEHFFSGFAALLETLYKKGRDIPVFVTYFQRKTNTFVISEMMMYLDLKKQYEDKNALAEALKNKMNSLKDVK